MAEAVIGARQSAELIGTAPDDDGRCGVSKDFFFLPQLMARGDRHERPPSLAGSSVSWREDGDERYAFLHTYIPVRQGCLK